MEDLTSSIVMDHSLEDQEVAMEEQPGSLSSSSESGHIPLSNDPSPSGYLEDYDINFHRRPLNVEVMEYYDKFEDEIEDVFPHFASNNILNSNPCDQLKPLIEKIIVERESVSSAAKNFDVCMEQSNLIRHQYGLPQLDMEHDFANSSEFCTYINEIRKSYLNHAGWKKITINVDGCHRESGFITPLDVALRELLHKFGGEKELKCFNRNEQNGSRCYSNITDSQVMEHDQNVAPIHGTPLYFSLYVDGTQVAENGATEAIVFRVRLDNLPKAKQVWRTVGFLVRNKDGTKCNERSSEKRQVVQRLLFHIIRPICLNPYIHENVCSRIATIVVDQPQERDLLSLLRSNTFRNCSVCRNMFGPCVERTTSGAEFVSMHSNYTSTQNENNDQPGTSNNFEISSQIPFSSPSPAVQTLADEASFNCTPRSVEDTVSAQLELAVLKHVILDGHSAQWPLYRSVINSINCSKDDVTSYMYVLRKVLRHECAREFPPALACLPLFGSPPFRLYRSIAYDVLHVMDLGIIRSFADKVHIRMSQYDYRARLSKSHLITVANKRIINLPSLARINRYAPFKMTLHEKQAPFTGAHWRNLVPFFWYSLLGLNQTVHPDNDQLFIAALSLDRFAATLRQVNDSKRESSSFTLNRVYDIENFGIECCQLMKNIFDTPETTKQHRSMNHLGEYLKMFGNLVYGDTSINESLHKGLKKSSGATNKKGVSLGLQLLQTNCLAEYIEEKEDGDENEYYYKDTVLLENSFNSKHEEVTTSQEIKKKYDQSYEKAGLLLADVESLSCFIGEDPDEIVQSLLYPSNDLQLRRKYQLIKATSITAYLPVGDENATPVKQTLRSELKDDYNWSYIEAVQYECTRLKPFHPNSIHLLGIVQSIVYSKPADSNSSSNDFNAVCIIRRLEEVSPEPGNERIVKEFLYKRLKYVEDNEDVWLDFVPLENVLQKVVILPDPSWLMKYSDDPFASYCRANDDQKFRKNARFFWMKNVRHSWKGQPKLSSDD